MPGGGGGGDIMYTLYTCMINDGCIYTYHTMWLYNIFKHIILLLLLLLLNHLHGFMA